MLSYVLLMMAAQTFSVKQLIALAAHEQVKGNIGINCRALFEGSLFYDPETIENMDLVLMAEKQGLIAYANQWTIPLAQLHVTEEKAQRILYQCNHQVDMLNESLGAKLFAYQYSL